MKKSPKIKEPFCGISHGIGVALSVGALATLLVMARGQFWATLAFAIYGASLILLYTASTLYHSLPVSPRVEAWLQRFDHCAIYLLIAGSYTPICLLGLKGVWGWSLLGTIWGLAIVGIGCSLLWHRAPDWWRVTLYLLMGWMVLIAIVPLHAAMPPAAFWWLIAGGVVYSVGAGIFATDKPHLWPGKFSAHDLWHIFVLGGSACQFFAIAGLAK